MVYTTVLIGKNKLSKMVKTMAQEGKLDKPVTKHSLCTYGVANMFGKSGHRSINGLRQYDRTSALQELQVCNALQSQKEGTEKAPVVAQRVAGPPSLPCFSGCVIQQLNFPSCYTCTSQLSATHTSCLSG